MYRKRVNISIYILSLWVVWIPVWYQAAIRNTIEFPEYGSHSVLLPPRPNQGLGLHSGWFQLGSVLISVHFRLAPYYWEVSGLIPDWPRFSKLYFSNWIPMSVSRLEFWTGARLGIQFPMLM